MQYPTYIKTIKTKRKTLRLKYVLIALLLIFVLVKGYGIKTDIFGGGRNESVLVDIKNGATAKEIAQMLKESGVIKYPGLFTMYARIGGKSKDFQLGAHTLFKSMSYDEIINIISQITKPVNSVTVTISEGSEIKQTARKLSEAFAQKQIKFSEEVFLNECENGSFEYPFVQQITRKTNRLEGYLFPATYTFYEETTERDVIEAMLSKFQQEYGVDFKERADALNLTTDEVITLASIIEREGASIEEFKTVSSVFHNRLRNNMRLESCATIQYILGVRKEILSTEDTRIKSPYNTYLNFGLPVGPIASPGSAAIEAALYPADTDYFYFRLNSEGQHVFSRTYREHRNAGQ